MKRKLLLSQIFFVMGLTNLIIVLLMSEVVTEVTRITAVLFSSILISVSLGFILFLSISYLSRIDKSFTNITSHLTPLFKFVFPGFIISFTLILLELGFVYNSDLIIVAVLMSIFFYYHIRIMTKVGYVVIGSEEMRFYDYSDNINSVRYNQIAAIKRIIFGAEYKIQYINENGKLVDVYFYPMGGSIFHEPVSIRTLKSRIITTNNNPNQNL